jgi:hypothetical protein
MGGVSREAHKYAGHQWMSYISCSAAVTTSATTHFYTHSIYIEASADDGVTAAHHKRKCANDGLGSESRSDRSAFCVSVNGHTMFVHEMIR